MPQKAPLRIIHPPYNTSPALFSYICIPASTVVSRGELSLSLSLSLSTYSPAERSARTIDARIERETCQTRAGRAPHIVVHVHIYRNIARGRVKSRYTRPVLSASLILRGEELSKHIYVHLLFSSARTRRFLLR